MGFPVRVMAVTVSILCMLIQAESSVMGGSYKVGLFAESDPYRYNDKANTAGSSSTGGPSNVGSGSVFYAATYDPKCAVVCDRLKGVDLTTAHYQAVLSAACTLKCECVGPMRCGKEDGSSQFPFADFFAGFLTKFNTSMSLDDVAQTLQSDFGTDEIWAGTRNLWGVSKLLIPAYGILLTQVMALHGVNELYRCAFVIITILPAYYVGYLYLFVSIFVGGYSALASSPNTAAERGVIGILTGACVSTTLTFWLGSPYDMTALIVAAAGIGYYVKMAFTPKVHLSDLAAVLNLLFIIVFISSSVIYAFVYGCYDSIGYRTISFLLTSIGPVNTSQSYLTLGAIYSSIELLQKFTDYVDQATLVSLVVPVILIRILIFLVFRVLITYRSMRGYHGSFDAKIAGYTLLLYFTDLFSPFRLILGSGDIKRNILNLVVEGSILTCEFWFAREVLFLRIVLSTLELIFDVSKAGSTRRFLMDDRVSLESFPVPGSLPWFDVDTFAKIRAAVIGIDIPGTIQGVGILLYDRSQTVLGTVRHVASWDPAAHESICNGIYYGNDGTKTSLALYSAGDYREASGGNDPVLFQPLRGCVDGVRLPAISKGEKPFVKALLIVNPTGAAAVITDFKFSADELAVVVNLKHGDSGSPVIGILKDGTYRYVGAVSAGSIAYGRPNLVSVIDRGARESSPGLGYYPQAVRYTASSLERVQALCQTYLDAEKPTDDMTLTAKRKVERNRGEVRRAVSAGLSVLFEPSMVETILADLDGGRMRAFNQARGGGIPPPSP